MSADGDVEVEADVVVEATTAAPVQTLDQNTAIQQVLKKALVRDGLARGLRECVKALDKRQAHLCFLAENCEEAGYTNLIKALCKEHNINYLTVPDRKQLGEWAGLCKIDKEGNARKVVACNCVVVKDFGAESEALSFLLELIKTK
eukprot:CAMPEP_0177629770 /NCGR_PEP_ID=MMETSP0447-20121125/845_1 /TAXON_ID=0 /ORGANISM="Stygamoeba regulata, Strain BSH-02190019" /LENGTH=145 /DNA_ID=CAMNT_0019131113 /DNA_START=142 /DNA_END=579 /DNA_ORIENTATION=-